MSDSQPSLASDVRSSPSLPSPQRQFTWDDVLEAAGPVSAEPANSESRRNAALKTRAYLEHPERIDPPDQKPPQQLAESLVTNLLPLAAVTDYAAHALTAEAGLACLQLLSTTWSCSLDSAALVSVVHYTDPSDPWTTSEAASSASILLEQNLTGAELAAFIAGPLLQTHLRPVFSRSSTRITPSGRPSHFSDPADSTRLHAEPSPWKRAGLQVVTDFQWAVRASHPDVLAKHWPLFMPVLLALAEDQEVPIRARGLEILVDFLVKCPAQILQTTGVATVFQDAVFPTLLYLPSLTPESDSLKLLDPAYRAILAIANMDADQQIPRRRRLLDKLLRDGIFAGYHNASQHVRIVQVLMQQTEAIVRCLGIFATKHLVALFSLFASVMTNPFAVTHPPVLLSASKALNATLVNCWPRMHDAQHAGQVTRIVILCWLNLHGGDGAPELATSERDAITSELTLTATFLESLWAQRELEPPCQWDEVLQRKPQLAKLFPALDKRRAACAP